MGGEECSKGLPEEAMSKLRAEGKGQEGECSRWKEQHVLRLLSGRDLRAVQDSGAQRGNGDGEEGRRGQRGKEGQDRLGCLFKSSKGVCALS